MKGKKGGRIKVAQDDIQRVQTASSLVDNGFLVQRAIFQITHTMGFSRIFLPITMLLFQS